MTDTEKEDPTKYLPKNNHVADTSLPVETQLDRIEKKLDAIIAVNDI